MFLMLRKTQNVYFISDVKVNLNTTQYVNIPAIYMQDIIID